MVNSEPLRWFPFKRSTDPLLDRSCRHTWYGRCPTADEDRRRYLTGPSEFWSEFVVDELEESVEQCKPEKKKKKKKRNKAYMEETITNVSPLKKIRSLDEVLDEIEQGKGRLPLFNFPLENSEDEDEIELDVFEPEPEPEQKPSESVGNLMREGPLKLCTQLADHKNVAPSSKDV
ncbi:uncharacterized protein LOC141591214 [Silene latifolia]|uniref:uncharacterized protein LOC141591214 n=1 Tax=Silene latifolia TaxID=37657 RepID=UPI003D781626